MTKHGNSEAKETERKKKKSVLAFILTVLIVLYIYIHFSVRTIEFLLLTDFVFTNITYTFIILLNIYLNTFKIKYFIEFVHSFICECTKVLAEDNNIVIILKCIIIFICLHNAVYIFKVKTRLLHSYIAYTFLLYLKYNNFWCY